MEHHYSLLLFIRWGPSQLFFFVQWANLIGPSLKKWNYGGSPKQKVIFWSIEFWRIKVRCYWELFGKHVRHLRTLCFDLLTPSPPQKLFFLKKHLTVRCPNPLSTTNTTWNKKTPPSSHPQEKRAARSQHDQTSQWFHANSIPKIGCHYFWPGLRAFLRTPYLLNFQVQSRGQCEPAPPIFSYFYITCWELPHTLFSTKRTMVTYVWRWRLKSPAKWLMD